MQIRKLMRVMSSGRTLQVTASTLMSGRIWNHTAGEKSLDN